MLESLLDRRLVVYSLLVFAVWIFLILWWKARKRTFAYGAGVALVLLLGFALLDAVTMTPRRQIARNLDEMAAAVKARDADRVFAHMASDFQFAGQDKEGFKQYSADVLKRGLVTDLVVWDLEWPEGGDERTRPVTFKAKPRGPWENEAYYLVKATFVREADGQWRLKSFEVFHPFVNSNTPLQPPGLPGR